MYVLLARTPLGESLPFEISSSSEMRVVNAGRENNTFTCREASQRPGGGDHTRLKRERERSWTRSVKWCAIRAPHVSVLVFLANRNRPDSAERPGLRRDDNGRRDVTTCVAFARGPLAALARGALRAYIHAVGYHRMGYHLAARRRYTTNRLNAGQ